MNNLRQVGLGILAALVSVAILFGSISLAMMENSPRVSLSSFMTWTPLPTVATPLTSTPLSSPSASPSSTPTLTSTPSSSVTASSTSSPVATTTPTASPTPTISPTTCHYPSGWSSIKVHSGDTLESLAATYNITPNALARANCLPSSDLSGIDHLYVPVRIAPTQTTRTCVIVAPNGWVNYTVQAGDTLFHLSQLFGITVQQLMAANCLDSDYIYAGEHLYVPHYLSTSTNVPTTKPSKTPKPPTSTPKPPTPTTPVTPTNTSGAPSNTPVPPPSNTPVPPPSNTPVPPPTDTPVPPPTDTPVPPPTDTPLPPPSDTPVPPDTPVPTTLFSLWRYGVG